MMAQMPRGVAVGLLLGLSLCLLQATSAAPPPPPVSMLPPPRPPPPSPPPGVVVVKVAGAANYSFLVFLSLWAVGICYPIYHCCRTKRRTDRMLGEGSQWAQLPDRSLEDAQMGLCGCPGSTPSRYPEPQPPPALMPGGYMVRMPGLCAVGREQLCMSTAHDLGHDFVP